MDRLIQYVGQHYRQELPILTRAVSPYVSRNIPSIFLEDYLARLSHLLSPSCFLASVIYLERMRHLVPMLPHTTHRLVLAVCTLAGEYLEDDFLRQGTFKLMAHLGGVSVTELSRLRLHTFQLLDYNVFLGATERKAINAVLKASEAPSSSLRDSASPRLGVGDQKCHESISQTSGASAVAST